MDGATQWPCLSLKKKAFNDTLWILHLEAYGLLTVDCHRCHHPGHCCPWNHIPRPWTQQCPQLGLCPRPLSRLSEAQEGYDCFHPLHSSYWKVCTLNVPSLSKTAKSALKRSKRSLTCLIAGGHHASADIFLASVTQLLPTHKSPCGRPLTRARVWDCLRT